MAESLATESIAEQQYQGEDFCFARQRGVFVILHTRHPPSDHEWREYVDAIERAIRRGERLITMVFTDGGAPNKPQRDAIAEFLKGREVSVVSNSSLARFVVSSMALFGMNIKSFAPERWRDAFDHLQLSREERSTLERLVRDLHRAGFARQVHTWRYTTGIR